MAGATFWLSLSLLLAGISHSFAWWAVGHMVVAEIARTRLTPEAKAHVDVYLGEFSGYYSGGNSMNASSIWADLIKSRGNSFFSNWHFVDYPIILGNVTAPPLDKENVVWALEHCNSLMRSTHNDAWGRALALRFLIHFVGDLHQPLHAVTRYSTLQPKGDRGGNNILLEQTSVEGAENLHGFWDAGAGALDDVTSRGDPEDVDENLSVKSLDVEAMAQSLLVELPYRRVMAGKTKAVNFTAWGRESYEVALENVYVGPFARDISARQYIDVPAEYTTQAQRAVKYQLAIAGFRLGALLNDLFPHPPTKKEATNVCHPVLGKDDGHRAAPILATALGLMTAVTLSLLAMLLRERGMCQKRQNYAMVHHWDDDLNEGEENLPKNEVTKGTVKGTVNGTVIGTVKGHSVLDKGEWAGRTARFGNGMDKSTKKVHILGDEVDFLDDEENSFYMKRGSPSL